MQRNCATCYTKVAGWDYPVFCSRSRNTPTPLFLIFRFFSNYSPSFLTIRGKLNPKISIEIKDKQKSKIRGGDLCSMSTIRDSAEKCNKNAYSYEYVYSCWPNDQLNLSNVLITSKLPFVIFFQYTTSNIFIIWPLFNGLQVFYSYFWQFSVFCLAITETTFPLSLNWS